MLWLACLSSLIDTGVKARNIQIARSFGIFQPWLPVIRRAVVGYSKRTTWDGKYGMSEKSLSRYKLDSWFKVKIQPLLIVYFVIGHLPALSIDQSVTWPQCKQEIHHPENQFLSSFHSAAGPWTIFKRFYLILIKAQIMKGQNMQSSLIYIGILTLKVITKCSK